ncbi:MAG: hypothetical protein RML38_09290, partial [Bacteroidia bacterium]|nr:hypothetical protein [Bacteroidia bacterium]
AQVICVRGMEHAVRQCEALAKHRSEAQCGMPRPLRSKGHAQKENFFIKNSLKIFLFEKMDF